MKPQTKPGKLSKGPKAGTACKHRVIEPRGQTYVCVSCGADVSRLAKKLKPFVERDERFDPEGQ